MPETTDATWTCSCRTAGFTYADYWDHLTLCGANNCDYQYCPDLYDYCPDCDGDGFWDPYGEEDEYRTSGIYSYEYKPDARFFGVGDYFLGVELEITADNMNAQPIYDWADDRNISGLFYCKEDSSVNGFEIVTHPMSPDFFDSVDWAAFFEMLERHYPMGGRDESSEHGLHVHVSRAAFSNTSTLARWSYMLNKYRDQVERIARRAAGGWAEFTDTPVSFLLPFERGGDRGSHGWETDHNRPLPCGCCYERRYVAPTTYTRRRQTQRVGYPGRYQVVNTQTDGGSTVEVRVFKSTRIASEFVSSVHFVAASVDYVRSMQPCNATRHVTLWETFADYVASSPVFSYDTELVSAIS